MFSHPPGHKRCIDVWIYFDSLCRNLGGRAVHGLKGIVSSIKANPKTSALVALGIVVGARLLFARSRRAI